MKIASAFDVEPQTRQANVGVFGGLQLAGICLGGLFLLLADSNGPIKFAV